MRRPLALAALLAAALLAAGGAAADPDEAARTLYAKTCSKCHGLIQEDRQSWRRDGLLQQAVTMPLGPPLSDVYLRPAGIVEGYAYSRAMRELASGWVWDEEALDAWLANSQEFARGSTMFLKVKQPDRGIIIEYLKTYARYRGSE